MPIEHETIAGRRGGRRERHGGDALERTQLHPEGSRTCDLRDLLDDPGLVEKLSSREAAGTLVELASLQTAIAARLRGLPLTEQSVAPALESDQLLTAEQVAERFNRSVAWVYRQAKNWSFTRRVTRRTVRFSETGLQRFLSQRRTFAP